MANEVCRLIADDSDPITGTNSFHAEKLESTAKLTLEQQLINDKSYGTLVSPDGTLFYTVENSAGGYMRPIQERRMINIALTHLDILVKPKFTFTTDNAKAILKIAFRKTKDDAYLDYDTLAYHGYPSGSLRGVCVFNADFIMTPDGAQRKGSDLQNHGYSIQFPDAKYKTWDGDQIARHEFGHGIPGLPHSTNPYNAMSPSYPIMAEYYTDEDKTRIWNKLPKAGTFDKIPTQIKLHLQRKSEYY